MRLESSTKLRLRDILVLRVSDVDENEMPVLAKLASDLSTTTNVPIVILQEGMDISSISEEQMNQMGWVRAPATTTLQGAKA